MEKLVLAVYGDVREYMGTLSKLRMIEFECYQNKQWEYITRKEYPWLEKLIFYRKSLNGYYGAIHNEDLQAARDFLLEEFNGGLIKSQSQGVRVLVIED